MVRGAPSHAFGRLPDVIPTGSCFCSLLPRVIVNRPGRAIPVAMILIGGRSPVALTDRAKRQPKRDYRDATGMLRLPPPTPNRTALPDQFDVRAPVAGQPAFRVLRYQGPPPGHMPPNAKPRASHTNAPRRPIGRSPIGDHRL